MCPSSRVAAAIGWAIGERDIISNTRLAHELGVSLKTVERVRAQVEEAIAASDSMKSTNQRVGVVAYLLAKGTPLTAQQIQEITGLARNSVNVMMSVLSVQLFIVKVNKVWIRADLIS